MAESVSNTIGTVNKGLWSGNVIATGSAIWVFLGENADQIAALCSIGGLLITVYVAFRKKRRDGS